MEYDKSEQLRALGEKINSEYVPQSERKRLESLLYDAISLQNKISLGIVSYESQGLMQSIAKSLEKSGEYLSGIYEALEKSAEALGKSAANINVAAKNSVAAAASLSESAEIMDKAGKSSLEAKSEMQASYSSLQEIKKEIPKAVNAQKGIEAAYELLSDEPDILS